MPALPLVTPYKITNGPASLFSSVLARHIPIDDSLFQKRPLEHWLVQVESNTPAERDEATRILADIFAPSAFDEPMNCHPLGGLDPSFQRDVLVARHHNKFISLHALPISAAPARIACRDDPPNNPDALR